MSPDVIGMIVALFAFTFSVLGGVAALLARQTKTLETRFDGRFDDLDRQLDRLELRMDRLELRMDRLEGEVSETKIAIARLEGPLPRLLRI